MLVSHQSTWLDQLALTRRIGGMRLWPRLLMVFGFAIAVTAADHFLHGFSAALTPLPFSMLGVALGIFLGFRNSASYDRFWEGRKLWGEQVNLSRTWARQVLSMIDRDAECPTPRQRQMVLGVVVYAHVLRQHLRDERDVAELGELPALAGCEAAAVARHRPNAVGQWLGERLADAARAGVIDPFHVPTLDHTLSGFTNVMGACERIKSTPIPGSYSVLIHRIVALYVFGLPFGMVTSTGFLTPLVVLFVAYAFLGLDAIGGEIEQPFGLDANDLALGAISRNIEIDLRELLGETDLPPPAAAINGVLS